MRKEWLNLIPAFTNELSCNFRQSGGFHCNAEERCSTDLSGKTGTQEFSGLTRGQV